MTKEIIAVFVGGGSGSLLRYAVQALLHERIQPHDFPWATLSVNIIGSFLIGLFYSLSARWNLSVETRLLLTTGKFKLTRPKIEKVVDKIPKVGTKTSYDDAVCTVQSR